MHTYINDFDVQGLLSQCWQASVLLLGGCLLLISNLARPDAQQKLPLYRQMEEYGIVSAAEESKVL